MKATCGGSLCASQGSPTPFHPHLRASHPIPTSAGLDFALCTNTCTTSQDAKSVEAMNPCAGTGLCWSLCGPHVIPMWSPCGPRWIELPGTLFGCQLMSVVENPHLLSDTKKQCETSAPLINPPISKWCLKRMEWVWHRLLPSPWYISATLEWVGRIKMKLANGPHTGDHTGDCFSRIQRYSSLSDHRSPQFDQYF